MAKVFDLAGLAARLRAGGQHRKLVGAIDRWTHRNSRAADLKHARQLLGHIERLRRENAGRPDETDFRSDAEGSLFVHAIILYARAAGDGDVGRRHVFDLKPVLSPEQLETHASLIVLRKTAIAHFDGEARQSWNRDAVMIVERGDGWWEYGFSHSRTLIQDALFERFVSLLDTIFPHLRDVLDAENDNLHQAMKETIAADPTVGQMLTENEFNSEGFFGGGLASDEFQRALVEPGTEFTRNVKFSLNAYANTTASESGQASERGERS